mgnify:CR=1 FL=1
MLVAEPNQPQGVWPFGRIVYTYPGKDGMVRAVTFRTVSRVQKTNNETVFARRSGSLGLVTVNSLDRVSTGGGNVPSAP